LGKIKSKDIITHKPEIHSFKIRSENDVLILGSKGLFQILEASEMVDIIKNEYTRDFPEVINIHHEAQMSVDRIMKRALLR